VVYLYLDRARLWLAGVRKKSASATPQPLLVEERRIS